MKTFNASDMAHKRTEIFKAAKDGGAIIQKKNTNGDVLEEFILTQQLYVFGESSTEYSPGAEEVFKRK